MELAVIGREDFCLGFMLVGIRNIFETEDAAAAIKKVSDDESIGVVVFDESLAGGLDEYERSRIEGSVRPVFVMLSQKQESDTLRRMIKKSIGVDLM